MSKEVLEWLLLLRKLLPRVGDILSYVVAYVLVMLVYYLCLYATYDMLYENTRWPGCGSERGSAACEERATVSGSNGQQANAQQVQVYVLIPKYVSDFIEQNIEVTVKNASEQIVTARVTIEYNEEVFTQYPWELPTVYLDMNRNDPGRQNTLTFEQMPPHSEVTHVGTVRISRPQPREQFRVKVYAFVGEARQEIHPLYNLLSDFNRGGALWAWFLQVFLLPPGSNWVALAFALPVGKLLVWLWEKRGSIGTRISTGVTTVRHGLADLAAQIAGVFRAGSRQGSPKTTPARTPGMTGSKGGGTTRKPPVSGP